MSDFGQLCPLFNTGVYNELYLGRISTTLYVTSSMNFLNGPGDLDTAAMSFNLGRTVVVTNFWVRRKVTTVDDTIQFYVGRQSDTGTAIASLFGTLELLSNITAYPDLNGHWQPADTIASFTLNTADYLFFGCTGDGESTLDLMVQYREK